MNGRKIRGRKYPWGVIEVDNESHCDFVKLRQMLIRYSSTKRGICWVEEFNHPPLASPSKRTHMEELKEFTNEVLYENFRTQKLSTSATGGYMENGSINMSKLEEERAAHEQKMTRMEAEMKADFQQKVAEKESKLKASEDELYARHREMKETLEKQRLELEEKKRRVESGYYLASNSAEKSKKPGKGLFK